MAKKKTPPKEEVLSLSSSNDVIQEETTEQDDMYTMVQINLPVRLNIKETDYGPGIVKVPRHMAETMLEMADKKRRADASVFTGNNYLVSRLADRTLVVRSVDKI